MANDDEDAAKEIRDYARKFAKKAIDNCVDIMEDEDQKGSARVRAAEVVLNRGFGAPERTGTIKHQHEHNHQLAHLRALTQIADQRDPLDKAIEDAEFSEVRKISEWDDEK